MKHALFDAHCHLAGADDEPPPPAEGGIAVRGRILCGVVPAEWRRVAEAAKAWPGTVAAYGVHPWYAGQAEGGWQESLEERLAADTEAWVGEIGLDGLRAGLADKEMQTGVFARQLRLAARLGRRVNLHCVKAWDELPRLLDAEYLPHVSGKGFIVHSFAGPRQFVKALAERGAFFSVGRLFSRRDSRRNRERTALIPEDRLLLESDAFVTPGADAAADLLHALDWLADVRKMSSGDLAALVMENSRRLFENA